MTPREALYNIIVKLGPIPQTLRDDNITFDEARLRDSIRTLQNFIHYHDPDGASTLGKGRPLPDSVESDFVHVEPSDGKKTDPDVRIRPRESVRGDGKDRLDTWRKEAGH